MEVGNVRLCARSTHSVFVIILGFLKIKFIVGKMYGIMLQTQQRISRIMLQRGVYLEKIS